ncbi:alpha/beta-hydrolase [Conidiobolus coronatus NRRL 28638]|uniref:Alpha/beta-hydrolase n=1 Tax=Conidiobolus coronatus (strain ATCC 28846 / CBS 209.66 / NRRL 28638) TaxID=796925 RepID=A0A137NY22_CONC2|nr:alpha/beta-hydrolase [Conidiobolus coronatus NRRL 28638]|eukprot:KXN67554.1 alpha/beta-hydrolase [Conidiobolus coronatus NRRL 28638]
MITLENLFKIGLKIANGTINSDLHSPNWGFMHGFAAKLLKSFLNNSIDLPIELSQFIMSSCKYLPWPGLEITRITIPDHFREEAYQWLKKHFEDKYGYYPVPKEHHWSLSRPLEAQWIIPTGRGSNKSQSLVYYIHGGGYIIGHSCNYNYAYRDLTDASSSNLFSIDYRLGPQYTISSMLEDVLAGYLYIISQKSQGGANINSTKLIISGESAGGGLILNLLHSIRYSNISSPAGAVLISPVTDLSLSQPSMLTNSKIDILWDMTEPVTLTSKGLNIHSALYYTIFKYPSRELLLRFRNDGTPFGPKETIFWPEISPLMDSNMNDLPPTITIVGERDSLRDSGIVYGKMRAEAEIKSTKKSLIPNIQTYVFEDMLHAFPVLPPNKYCIKALKTVGEFIYQVMNANNELAINSRNYSYIPDYKKSYMHSTYNMYWNNIKNEYIPWNSSYTTVQFPTSQVLTLPGPEFVPLP